MKTGYKLPHFKLFFLSPVINRQGQTAFQVWKAWQRLHKCNLNTRIRAKTIRTRTQKNARTRESDYMHEYTNPS